MQTYATVKTLQRLGHHVCVINLVHPKHNNSKRTLSPSVFLSRIRQLQFGLFRLFYIGHLTKRMYSINKKYIPECDYTIVGSDQVWNSDITSPISMPYFLDFAKKGTKLSYASSFGKSVWENDADYTEKVKELLSEFKAISVRESSGIAICHDVFKVEATQLLDPTLICGNYSELVKEGKIKKQVYPFLLVNNESTKKISNLVSQELRIPLYEENKYRFYFKRSPKAWLNRMRNSAFIITDSFHGLAFSLLFHKPFIVVCADAKKFTRLQSLLQLVKLENRFVKSFDDLATRKDLLSDNINYVLVDRILEDERNKALSFLERNLK